MTENMIGFEQNTTELQDRMQHAAGLRKGIAAVNLKDMFRARGVFFDENDNKM